MKKISLLVGLFSVCNALQAQNFEVLNANENAVEFRHSLLSNAQQNVTIDNQQYISYSKTNKITIKNIGEPELPMFSESILVPNKGATSISVQHDGYIEYTNILVAPSKGSLKRNVNPSNIAYTFGAAYNQNNFYPGVLAQDHEPFNIRNTRGVAVTIYPYQYNPVTKVLRVYQNIRVTVNTNPLIAGLNEVDGNEVYNNEFSQVYEHSFINSSTLQQRYTQVSETGEMLIICPTSFSSQVQPLADWKNQKGIKTTVVSTTTTGSTAANIKTYIQNYYTAHPNLIYILLVGDHADVPAYSYGSNGSDILWSDTYYAQLAGGANDLHPDVFIGRFSGNSSQITTMVNRTLEYEKSPAAGNWMTKAIGIGSDLGAGIGDDGEADWQHERNLRTKLMAFGYTAVAELYDGSHTGVDASGNPTATNVVTAINGGASLMNYTGHGDVDLIVTTNFTSTNINAASNNGFYPFVVSVACNNGQFTAGDCISENWLRNSNGTGPKGAIATVGSSILMAWAEPMQTQDEIVDILTNQYPSNRKKTIGGLFYNSQISMLDQYNNTSSSEVMKTWVFFGDPSTMFRDQLTQSITATHVSTTAMGTTSIVVTCAVEGALICISQNNVILGTGIVSGGTVTITFPAINSSTSLLVTATQQNYGIYQGNISISGTPSPAVSILGSDTDNTICAGNSITFTATPSNSSNPTYQWQVNGINVSGETNPTFNTSTLTNGQNVTCVMNDNGSPITSNSVTITVNSIPAQPTLTSNSPVCSGTLLTLSTPTVSGATYAWSGPSYTSATQNVSITSSTVNNSGVFTVTITTNGCSSSNTTNVVVSPAPTTPTISLSGSTLTSSATTGNQWYLNGVAIVGATNQTYNVTSNGVYTVSSTSGGCTSANSSNLNFNSLGLNEQSLQSSLLIYPNPSNGIFTIDYTSSIDGNYSFKIQNQLGQIILIEHVSNTLNKKIDLRSYGKGEYFISIENTSSIQIEKIIIE